MAASLTDRITTSFERLSRREQVMVAFVVVAGFSLVIGLFSYVVGRDLDKRDKRIAAKLTQLEQVAGLRGDYQRRLADQNRIANDIRRNNTMRLLSYIEDTAKRSSIEIGNAQERAGSQMGGGILKEEDAEITVRDVSIDRLYDVLTHLEQGNPLVMVRTLKVRKRYADPKRLEATITVGTFKTTS